MKELLINLTIIIIFGLLIIGAITWSEYSWNKHEKPYINYCSKILNCNLNNTRFIPNYCYCWDTKIPTVWPIGDKN